MAKEKKTTTSFQKNVDTELYKKAKVNIKKHFKRSTYSTMKKSEALVMMLEYFADDSNFEGKK